MALVSPELELVEEIRAHGPFEDWRARTDPKLDLPPWVIARRPSAERRDTAALAERLARAAEISERASHHLVLQTLGVLTTPDGVVLQLSEDFDGLPLDLVPAPTHLEVTGAVFIARQVAEAVAHGHANDVLHRSVSPEAIWVGRNGDVKVDFGLSGEFSAEMGHTTPVDVRFSHPEWIAEGVLHPKVDVYAVAAVLWWLVVGRPFRTSMARPTSAPASARRPGVPPALDAVLSAVLGVEPRREPWSARRLADALDRVFYADLGADDELHGAGAVGSWVEPHLMPLVEEESDDSLMAVESIVGRLTRAIALREEPVPPADLTAGDLGVVEVPTGETPTPPSPPIVPRELAARRSSSPVRSIPPASTAPLDAPPGFRRSQSDDLLQTPRAGSPPLQRLPERSRTHSAPEEELPTRTSPELLPPRPATGSPSQRAVAAPAPRSDVRIRGRARAGARSTDSPTGTRLALPGGRWLWQGLAFALGVATSVGVLAFFGVG